MRKSISFAFSLAFAVVGAEAAAADTFVLSNTNSGAGTVNVISPSSFDIFMDTTSTNTNLTTTFYTVASASRSGTATFNWTYTDPNYNSDGGGTASYEWAGYVEGLTTTAQTQLAGYSPPTFTLDGAGKSSGAGSFSVAAGDTYGFYITTSDSLGFSAADLLITNYNFAPTVTSPGPTPGAGLMSLAALLLAGAALKARGALRRG